MSGRTEQEETEGEEDKIEISLVVDGNEKYPSVVKVGLDTNLKEIRTKFLDNDIYKSHQFLKQKAKISIGGEEDYIVKDVLENGKIIRFGKEKEEEKKVEFVDITVSIDEKMTKAKIEEDITLDKFREGGDIGKNIHYYSGKDRISLGFEKNYRVVDILKIEKEGNKVLTLKSEEPKRENAKMPDLLEKDESFGEDKFEGKTLEKLQFEGYKIDREGALGREFAEGEIIDPRSNHRDIVDVCQLNRTWKKDNNSIFLTPHLKSDLLIYGNERGNGWGLCRVHNDAYLVEELKTDTDDIVFRGGFSESSGAVSVAYGGFEGKVRVDHLKKTDSTKKRHQEESKLYVHHIVRNYNFQMDESWFLLNESSLIEVQSIFKGVFSEGEITNSAFVKGLEYFEENFGEFLILEGVLGGKVYHVETTEGQGEEGKKSSKESLKVAMSAKFSVWGAPVSTEASHGRQTETNDEHSKTESSHHLSLNAVGGDSGSVENTKEWMNSVRKVMFMYPVEIWKLQSSFLFAMNEMRRTNMIEVSKINALIELYNQRTGGKMDKLQFEMDMIKEEEGELEMEECMFFVNEDDLYRANLEDESITKLKTKLKTKDGMDGMGWKGTKCMAGDSKKEKLYIIKGETLYRVDYAGNDEVFSSKISRKDWKEAKDMDMDMKRNVLYIMDSNGGLSAIFDPHTVGEKKVKMIETLKHRFVRSILIFRDSLYIISGHDEEKKGNKLNRYKLKELDFDDDQPKLDFDDKWKIKEDGMRFLFSYKNCLYILKSTHKFIYKVDLEKKKTDSVGNNIWPFGCAPIVGSEKGVAVFSKRKDDKFYLFFSDNPAKDKNLRVIGGSYKKKVEHLCMARLKLGVLKVDLRTEKKE